MCEGGEGGGVLGQARQVRDEERVGAGLSPDVNAKAWGGSLNRAWGWGLSGHNY